MKLGITGHQDLGPEATVEWVERVLLDTLRSLKPDQGWSSLAQGADQLFALALFKLNLPITAVIPCKHYEATFDDGALHTYQDLLTKVFGKVELAFEQPSEEAFWEAGKYIVNETDMLCAIWNGEKAKGLGGTGDVVEYALQNNKPIVHINPVTRTVKDLKHGK